MADSRFHIEVAIASKSRAADRARGGAAGEAGRAALAPGQADEEAGRRVEPLAPSPAPVPLDSVALDHVTAAEEHAAIAAAIEAEDGSRARLLAEEHAEANLRRLTALRLALPPQP